MWDLALLDDGEDLRHDLNNDFVDLHEEIYVEVWKVDSAHGRIELRESDEPAEEVTTAPA